jgi:hypothetical protein
MIPKALNFDVISAWMGNAHRRMSRKHSSHPVLAAGLCYTEHIDAQPVNMRLASPVFQRNRIPGIQSLILK